MAAPLLVLIPAYNEALRIGRVITEIRNAVRQARVVVIDDGSEDPTADAARRAGAHVIRHPINLGYGAALQTGYLYALSRGAERVVQMDGDGQHDPQGIPLLARALDTTGSNVVIGSRFLGNCLYRIPAARRIGMSLFALAASRLTGQAVTDPTSGFQALDRTALAFYASDRFPLDYPDADVIVMLHYAGLTFREAPVTMRASLTGKSMHGGIIGPVYYVFKMTLSLALTILRSP